ncbi:hypothetical protein KPLM21_610034 [Klebsiella pneumoniae]|nr:hypothetical protein KPLM21_610034 [Klebsiella pneumoniae]
MKVICTSPSFAKYDDAPISALKEADLELVMLPADASIEMLAQHLPDAIAMILPWRILRQHLILLDIRMAQLAILARAASTILLPASVVVNDLKTL